MAPSIICIIDILGTRGRWTEGGIEGYFKAMEEIEKMLVEAKSTLGSQLQAAALEFDFISFSDTLVLTFIDKRNDNLKGPYFFHESVLGFSQMILGVFQICFANHFFARGAISYGEIDKRGNHFVGSAVDDAAEYFELQDMIGICFTPKASLAIENAIAWNQQYFSKKIDHYIIKYKTPLKNHSPVELYQINWIKEFIDKATTESPAYSTLCGFLSNRNVPLIALSKFENTIDFFKYVSSRG